jgi:hypothetical protein
MNPILPFVLPLLVPVAAWRIPADIGSNLMLLDMPRHVVAGDDLALLARCRPGLPYVVVADTTVTRRIIRGVPFYPVNPVVVAFGHMPPSGEAIHSLPTPAFPGLDGLEVYFQALNADPAITSSTGASTFQAVKFHRDDGQPLIKLFTVNRIPRSFNGSEPNEGTLVTPPTGFTVDVFFDPRGQGPIDPSSLVVTADVPLANGSIAPGTNLAPFFTIGPHSATGTVDSTWEFPTNIDVTLTADVANASGRSAPRETYSFRAMRFTNFTQPFETRQLWHLDFDTHDLDRSGVPDYREDLVLFGLGNDASDQNGPAARVAQWTKEAIVAQLRETFRVNQPGGVNVNFKLRAPAGIHSRICIGGRNPYPPGQLPPGATETTGAASLNARNQRHNIVNCGGVLGVHPRSIFHLFKDVVAFRTVFGPLQRNPVGNDPEDDIVTSQGFDPDTGTARQRARYIEIRNGVDAFSNATSFILTQETCHSMGLVGGGILPSGQLGGEPHGGSTNAHTDDGQGNFMSGNNSTPAPSTGQNLEMIWNHFQSGRAHFMPFNWAYLREQTIHQ